MGLGLGRIKGVFCSSFGVNINLNCNIAIGETVSYSCLLNRVQCSSYNSNFLLLKQELWKYNNNIDVLRLIPNADHNDDPFQIYQQDSLAGSGIYWRRRMRLYWVQRRQRRRKRQRKGNGKILLSKIVADISASGCGPRCADRADIKIQSDMKTNHAQEQGEYNRLALYGQWGWGGTGRKMRRWNRFCYA